MDIRCTPEGTPARVAFARVRVRPSLDDGRPSRRTDPTKLGNATVDDLMRRVNAEPTPADADWVVAMRNVAATPTYGGSTFARAGDAVWYSRPIDGTRDRVSRATTYRDLQRHRDGTLGGKNRKGRRLADGEALLNAILAAHGVDVPAPTGCLPSAPIDTLAHGRSAASMRLLIAAADTRGPEWYAYRADPAAEWTRYSRWTGEPVDDE